MIMMEVGDQSPSMIVPKLMVVVPEGGTLEAVVAARVVLLMSVAVMARVDPMEAARAAVVVTAAAFAAQSKH